jgi:hypothetical protein
MADVKCPKCGLVVQESGGMITGSAHPFIKACQNKPVEHFADCRDLRDEIEMPRRAR